jgi:hypothetical protein
VRRPKSRRTWSVADFGADVGVFGVELGKLVGAGVDIRK